MNEYCCHALRLSYIEDRLTFMTIFSKTMTLSLQVLTMLAIRRAHATMPVTSSAYAIESAIRVAREHGDFA